jgi:hypothetical protein
MNAKLVACCLVFAGVVIACAALWDLGPGPHIAQHRWAVRAEAKIRELRHKRPPDVSQGSWEFLVGWTMNLSANCAAIPKDGITDRDQEAFLQEFDERLQRGPDVATIDWIWDEYIRLTKHGQTKHGQSYSDKYRPTRPETGWERAPVGCFGMPVE